MKILRLIADGSIYEGMTKADVRNLLGEPPMHSHATRKYKEPMIWRYGKYEFWFDVQKYRTPYPGPKLTTVFDESKHKTIPFVREK